MRIDTSQRWACAVAVVAAAAGMLIPVSANSSATYSYDQVGQLRSALYDNGACVVYDYDPAGNRTSQTNTVSDTPEESTWGSGYWGCFKWTAP